ncbi:hypothetical protein DXA98_10570 [Lachnospiraceae bacterium OF09-6]|nr:hypothetical protein DXA98_10570 [Lachnospiraceae bacterium OF09-6]
MLLKAEVTFHSVDGNKIKQTYEQEGDLYSLLDSVCYKLTEEDNFNKTEKPLFPGINGIVDITKSISIVVNPM